MRSMPSAGLIDTPPVSNVIPLPIKASTGQPARSPVRDEARSRAVAARCPERPTARVAFPVHECEASSRTSTPSPHRLAADATRSANSAGVSTFAGLIGQFRV
jgi:hypothetical protein